MLPSLPHLRRLLVDFFEGTLITWQRFITEYEEGGTIAGLTTEQCKLGYMDATNDVNEGTLGRFRQVMRQNSNMTETTCNSRASYTYNNVAEYLNKLSPNYWGFIRKQGREIDGSELEAKRRKTISDHNKEKAEKGEKKLEERQDKIDKKTLLLNGLKGLKIIESIEELNSPKISHDDLKLQLEWHRRFNPSILMKTKLKLKRDTLAALRVAIGQYHQEYKFLDCPEVRICGIPRGNEDQTEE